MSDTPKTDELAKREFVPDGLWIRHARELEHENAVLRSLVREAMAEHVDLYDLDKAEDFIARAKNVLGEGKP